MPSNYTIKINNLSLEIISMNASLPKLFQVFVLLDNKKTRFHLQQTEQGNLGFAMPEACPAELLAIEKEIAAKVVANFTATK